MVTWRGVISVPLMLINWSRDLRPSALSLEVWAQQASVIIPQGSGPCQRAGREVARGAAGPGWPQMCFPPVPGKVLIQKQMYLSLPTAPQGRASCLRVEWQLAGGTVAGGQRKFHISPRFLPLCSGPAGPASHGVESGLPASPRDPGSRQRRAFRPRASPALPQRAAR